MRKFYFFLLAFCFSVSMVEAGTVDPFVFPFFLKEFPDKKKEKKFEVKEVLLFKPVIPYPLSEMIIDGIVGRDQKNGLEYYLVVTEKETGRVFVLKEGDAVSPNEKIVKITPGFVRIEQYVKVNGKISKKTVVLKVDSEG